MGQLMAGQTEATTQNTLVLSKASQQDRKEPLKPPYRAPSITKEKTPPSLLLEPRFSASGHPLNLPSHSRHGTLSKSRSFQRTPLIKREDGSIL